MDNEVVDGRKNSTTTTALPPLLHYDSTFTAASDSGVKMYEGAC